MMQQQRRSYIRKTLNPLPYVSLPSGNGGIVLDVSEQGLCFRALAPVKQSGPIHFSFSAHSKLIEGVADLVWTDRAKKTGGLRFTHLSDDAREQIRGWPHELDLRLSVGQGFMLQIPAAGDSSTPGALRRSRFDATLHLATTWSNRVGSTLRESLDSAKKLGMAGSDSLQKNSRFQEGKRRILNALPVIILAIVASTLFFYIHHRKEKDSIVQFDPRIGGEVHPQKMIQKPVPNPLPPATGVSQAADEKSKIEGALGAAIPQIANATPPVIATRNALGPPAPKVPLANIRVPAPVSPSGKFVIQVAALTQETSAHMLVNSLQHKDFKAFVGTLPVDKLYRVMIGPYADEVSARLVMGELKKEGFDSFVRRESGVVLAGSLEMKTP
jgi:cell division septation protein DedD